MSIAQNFPNIAPSLDLSFALTKKLDPRITFSRASSATYYGTQTAKAEENLLLRSQEFNSAYWGKIRLTVTANATNAPDGTTTAEALTQATGQTLSGDVRVSLPVVIDDYTVSIFAKPNGKNFLQIYEELGTGASRITWFDVQNGTVGTTDAGHTASISASTDGYYRCSITFSVNAARTDLLLFRLADTDGSTTVTDSGGLYIWGAQLEARDSVTAYTPTTDQPITNYIPVLQTASANVARFDHSPTTGESLGLLVEEQRTNLLTYSEQFDNAAWAKTRTSIVSNTIVAPDGTLTGDKLVENTDNNSHNIARNITSTDVVHTFSFYAKAAERSVINATISGSTAYTIGFNLATGALSARLIGGTTTATSASITPVGNGWYRCSLSQNSSAGTAIGAQIWLTDGTTPVYTGDGYSGIYIWGAQLEAGAFPTSYIKTEASQVTRSADSASMTGTNFSSWFNNGEGGIYLDSKYLSDNPTNFATLFSISDNTTSNRINVRKPSFSATEFLVISSGTTQVQAIRNFAQQSKMAIRLETDNFAARVNNQAIVQDTSAVIPSVSRLYLNATDSGVVNNSCHIKKFAFYPKALTDTQLQALTS